MTATPTAEHRGVALVTGAAKRIGRVIALRLARHGYDVAIHYNGSAEDADNVCAEIRALGRNSACFSADLADRSAVDQLLPACASSLGAPSCLINNASLFVFDDPATMTSESWDRHLAVNLTAPVSLAQQFAKLQEADRAASIINIIDQRVLRPTPEFFSYAISKAALWDATRMLAQAFAPTVRVNAIGPGPVLANIHQSPDDFAAEAASTLLGRQTDPTEIADAVCFILDAPAMTGQMIALDSGQHLSWSSELGLAERSDESR